MKRFITVMVAIILMLSIILTGCGGSRQQESKDSGSADTQAVQTSTADTQKIPLTWDSEELTWKKDKSPAKFSIFINDTLFAYKKWDSDVALEITKRTGVTLDLVVAANANQLDVLLASDSLPELVYSPTGTRLENSEVSYPWDEIIPKYAPEFMDLLQKDEIFYNTKDDGHFYTIKSHYISEDNWKNERTLLSPGTSTMGIREDILEALGNPRLESLDDLLSIFKTVKEKYPDIMVYVPYWPLPSPIAEWMGLTPDTYVKDGKVYAGISNPDWLKYYKLMNQLIRDGYMPEEVLTYSPDQLFQMFFAGKVFAGAANAGFDRVNQVLKATNVPGKFKYVKEPLAVDGQIKFKPVLPVAGFAGLYITKNCSNPQRAIAFAQFMKSPEGMKLTKWGIEGVHYNLNEDGIPIMTEAYKAPNSGTNVFQFLVDGLTESMIQYAEKYSEPVFAPEKIDYLQSRKAKTERDLLLGFAVPIPESDEYYISIKMFEIKKTYEPQILTAKSDEECEAKYAAMMKEMETAGIKKYETNITEQYNKAKIRYEEFLKNEK